MVLWAGFLICMILLCRAAIVQSVPPYLARTAERFHFSEWGGRTKEPYAGPLMSWNLPELSLPTNGMGVRVEIERDDDEESFSICPANRGFEFFNVTTRRYSDVLSAQVAIIYRFDSMQSTVDYSSATNDFGDRSYVAGRWAVFSRNNIYVCVRSYTNSISAEVVARQIDTDILQKSKINHE